MAKTPKKPHTESNPNEVEPEAAESVEAAGTDGTELPEPDDATLKAIEKRNPPPSAIQRAAYLSQYSDADCVELAHKTRAELVLGEAGAWAVVIDRALHEEDGPAIDYRLSRFGFFLETRQKLSVAVEQQNVTRGAVKGIKNTAESAEQTARTAEDDLTTALRAAAGERTSEKQAIESARPAGNAPEQVTRRLRLLAALGKKWLASKDELFQVLVSESGLTAAMVERALGAANDLATARTGARGVRINPRDTPAVNLIEGRMLVEMRYAMNAFEAANGKNSLVPKLIPGSASRAALAPPSGRKTAALPAPEPEDDGEETPASAKKSTAAPKNGTPATPDTSQATGATQPSAADSGAPAAGAATLESPRASSAAAPASRARAEAKKSRSPKPKGRSKGRGR